MTFTEASAVMNSTCAAVESDGVNENASKRDGWAGGAAPNRMGS